ncbi:hypothetical protein BGX31_011157 [Mortierella sp. GBA43]|nr:hypothetical protein BGX31_011157 [Mortierella sp. GBA43]
MPVSHPLPTSPPPESPRPNPGHYYQQQHHVLPSPTSPYYAHHAPFSQPHIVPSSIMTSGISVPTTPTTITSHTLPIPSHSPVTMSSAPILYKAEMSENQANTWKKQHDQQNVKVEIQSGPMKTPPSSILSHAKLSTPTAPAPGPSQEIHSEMGRPSPTQEHSRPMSTFGSWNQAPISTNTNVPLQSPTRTTYPGQSSLSSSTISMSSYPTPTPVELQSSLTDNTPIHNKLESSLTTLDPAPAAAAGINARVSRPYGSSSSSQPSPSTPVTHGYPPSAIEAQSPLTEIDGTTSKPLSGSGPSSGSSQPSGIGAGVRAGSGPGQGSGPNFGGQGSHGYPGQFQNHGNHQNNDFGGPSAIEAQSSLTEIDNLPFPIEAQSSLTVVDDLPYTLEEQSALTELDSLPHPLHEQSSLTVVDDLPHALHEQSSLTEVDSLPHGIAEQSSLTELDPVPRRCPSSPAGAPMAAYSTKGDTAPEFSTQKNKSAGSVQAIPASVYDDDDDYPSPPPPGDYDLDSKGTTAPEPRERVVRRCPSSPAGAPLAAYKYDDLSLAPPVASFRTKGDTAPEFATQKNKAPGSAQATTPRVERALPPAPPPLPPPAAPRSTPRVECLLPPPPAGPRSNIKGATTPEKSTPRVERLLPPPPAAPRSDIKGTTVPDRGQGSGSTQESPFSMSNWTMPSDFSDPSFGDGSLAKQPLSPTGSLHKRSPATMLMNTSTAGEDDDLVAAHVGKSDGGNILIPLSPAATEPTFGSGPPVPAPKPASLTANKTNHPQAASSGTQLTRSEEIRLSDTATDGNILIPLPEEAKRDQHHGQNGLDQVEADNDMNAFIQELQSSMSLSRSGSGAGAMTGSSSKHKGINDVKRTDSSSSRTSQSREQAKEVAPAPAPAPELQQLEATQFEWTFSETEQAAYERIYTLWERPAEECVSSDIAGKVFMTLGLSNTDLYNIWQLLNPEERQVLTRTQFIAGLHLVNCKVVGYELPDDLPDELMMSAASVGRVVIPPRPIQGPAAIQSNYVEPAPAPAPEPPVPNTSLGSDPMSSYNITLPTHSSIVPTYPAASSSTNRDNEGIYLAYPHQPYQQQNLMPVHVPLPDQYGAQYRLDDKGIPPPHTTTTAPAPPPPVAASYPMITPASASHPIPEPAPASPVRPSKPGPHALHDLPDDAPVMVSGVVDLPGLHDRHNPFAGDLSYSGLGSGSGAGYSGAHHVDDDPSPPPPATELVQPIMDMDLYASPPDAWDHDAAPPELDVDGSYIKYRSDMTLSASVTANHPINPSSGVFYFEITVDQSKGNAMSIGIASKSLRKNCQVGWDLNSWGYHNVNGYLFFGNGNQSIQYSYEFNEEDVIGCGINFFDRTVFFTLNGHMLGVAFRFIKDTLPLYPAVGLSHSGTVINANFGDQTFLFNIVDYKKSVMSRNPQTQPMITWNGGARDDKLFRILSDNLTVVATGNAEGCIRGPKVSPRDRDVFYFEVTIVRMPPTDTGVLMIGICGKDQSMKDTLGWKANSYGYSCESGDYLSISSNRSSLNARSQSGKMKARARGLPFSAGSTVGCGVDFASRELFFTLNGECLGQAFYELDVLDCHPCVCVMDAGDVGTAGGPISGPRPTLAGRMGGSTGSGAGTAGTGGAGDADRPVAYEFRANFGQAPFAFDMRAFEVSGGH